MNDETPTRAQIVLEDSNKSLTGKQAADHLVNSFGKISDIHIPEDREKEVLEQQKTYRGTDTEEEEVMTERFTDKELEEGI